MSSLSFQFSYCCFTLLDISLTSITFSALEKQEARNQNEEMKKKREAEERKAKAMAEVSHCLL